MGVSMKPRLRLYTHPHPHPNHHFRYTFPATIALIDQGLQLASRLLSLGTVLLSVQPPDTNKVNLHLDSTAIW